MKPLKAIKLHEKDNVAVVLQDSTKNTPISVLFDGASDVVTLKNDIPLGHKLAMRDIKPNDKIIKYGYVVAIATEAIKCGEYVHIHNIKSANF